MKNGLIKRLYAYRFLDDFILIYPLYQILFTNHGLDLVQISWLFVIWSVVSIVADVPTGVLADRYSRKNLLALGQVIRVAGFVSWLLYPNFWGFAAGFALWGIGSAFDSGTFEALVFDELKAVKAELSYVRIAGRARSFGLIGNLLANVLAAGAVTFGFTFLLVSSMVAVLGAAAVAFSIPEAPRQEPTGDAGYFSELWEGTREAFKTPAILNVILLGGFITAMFGSLEEYTPLFFKDVGLSLNAIPLGEAALVLAAVGASLLAHKYEKLHARTFILMLGLAGLLLVCAGRGFGLGGILLLGGFFFLTKVLETIYDGKLQHGISSHRRATITSVGGFAAEILSLGIYVLFGYIAEAQGTVAAFGWLGLIVVIVATLYLLVARRLFMNLGEVAD